MAETLPVTQPNPDGPAPATPSTQEATEQEKEQPSRFLTEGTTLLLLSACTYLATYLYELGYAKQLNIPIEFISISIQNLVYCGGTTIIFVIACFYILQSWLKLHELPNQPEKPNILLLFLKKWGLVIVMVMIIGVATHGHWLVLGIVLPAIIVSLVEFGRPFKGSFDRAYKQAVIEALKSDAQVGWTFNDIRLQKIRNATGLALMAAWLSTWFGLGEAWSRDQFPFIGDTTEAIVRRYGDMLVIGKFDPKSGYLLNEFRLVKVDKIKDRIVMRRVGALGQLT